MNRNFYTVRVTANGFCRFCRCECQIYRRRLDHMFQLIVTLVTLGLWAIPWLVIWLFSLRRPWRCRTCRRVVENSIASDAAQADATAAPWVGSGRL